MTPTIRDKHHRTQDALADVLADLRHRDVRELSCDVRCVDDTLMICVCGITAARVRYRLFIEV